MHYPKNDKPSTGLHLVLMIVMFALIMMLGFATSARENGRQNGSLNSLLANGQAIQQYSNRSQHRKPQPAAKVPLVG